MIGFGGNMSSSGLSGAFGNTAIMRSDLLCEAPKIHLNISKVERLSFEMPRK